MIRTFPFVALLLAAPLFADGPADNVADNVRRVPPPGVAIPDADRQELQAGADALGKEISELRTSLKGKPALLDLLPDVQIFHKAVDWALRYNEFYDVKEVAVAKQQLQLGMERAKALRDGKPSWPARTGLVVRGYVSKIDGSVQPYGLVVPPTYKPDYPHKYRLDFWCHGRGEKLTELSFIQGRLNSPGEFTPPNAFVLHLYGRYCNANKFAGEVDLFEAYESVKKQYPIDEHRLVIRGFSMGGAACWQFAVHYPSFFAAAAPGAGFSETADFLKVFQKESLQPTWYEQRLWRWYDCTDYAINLTNLPTVAYSGEIDSQKQAADMMTAALAKEGVELTHIIGPKTGHAYHPDAKKEINRRIDGIVERGRNTVPQRVRFTTWTLRYNQAFWVTIDGFEDVIVSRRQPRIDARLQPGVGADGRPTHVHVNTQNVSAFTLSLSPGLCPLDPAQRPRVSFLELGSRPVPGGEEVQAAPVLSDRSWVAHFRKFGGHWQAVESADDGALAKRHGLQGPIDDAFLDHFIIVKPTGTPMHEATGKWVEAEMAHAV
ncbi:MAG: prolyl oligopeptidase family serine peptidase, partial [Gemmataceae bacterium]